MKAAELKRRIEALEAGQDALKADVKLQLATQSQDFLNAYEKTLAVSRKMVKRMADAADASEGLTTTDRRFLKAQARARRIGKLGG
jgi:hypothetical protein